MQWEMESSRFIRCFDTETMVFVTHKVRENEPQAV